MKLLHSTYQGLMSERWRASFGALLGLGMCTVFLHAVTPGNHWMLAPLGATLVILHVQPHSPVAQPWPVIGSYLLCCVAGLACAQWIAAPQLSVTVAVACAIWLMVRFGCIHPPGGALALLIALDGPRSADAALRLAVQVGLDVGMAILSTMLVSHIVLRRPYPYTAQAQEVGRHQTADAAPLQRLGLVHDDLASAVQSLDTFVDVQEDELVEIYNLAVDHAFGRNMGLTCGDIMSRDVITTHFDTDLEEAWSQLRQHRIKSLPVVDTFGRLIGIATMADFLRQIDHAPAPGIARRLQGLLRRTPGVTSDKPEVVGQIMTAHVFSANPETPIATLVVQMSDHGLPHIPVVDAQRKVVGMVTQSDMLAALYQHIAVSHGPVAA